MITYRNAYHHDWIPFSLGVISQRYSDLRLTARWDNRGSWQRIGLLAFNCAKKLIWISCIITAQNYKIRQEVLMKNCQVLIHVVEQTDFSIHVHKKQQTLEKYLMFRPLLSINPILAHVGGCQCRIDWVLWYLRLLYTEAMGDVNLGDHASEFEPLFKFIFVHST